MQETALEIARERIEHCRLSAKRGTLDLSGLGLKTVPPEIGEYSRLPPQFGQLTGLRELRLGNNQLTELPPQIGRLTELRSLDLSLNQFSSLPAEIGQFRKLDELYLNNNHLETLPCEIGQLRALTRLHLQRNRLTALPVEIGQLSLLFELLLNHNQLALLPEEIGKLTRLTTLTLANNALTFLPDALKACVKLERISAARNGLTTLPLWLLDTGSMTHLMLHGNEALNLPPEILGDDGEHWGKPNVRPILDYFSARQMQGEEPMREVRVLLVGRGRAGKTSLLKALRDEKADRLQAETAGITVLPLELNCEQGKATAHAWDFGGQEFLHGTHQIFLSERCIYVLVLEGRESNWELETDYWLRFIQSYGGESPVIVALNKYDVHAFSVDRYRLQERCPQIVGFIETDAFTLRGVDELRRKLEQTANRMEHVWIGVPKKWHRIKEDLKALTQNYLDYKHYQALCVKLKMTLESEQDSLAVVLHRLGIALNFREHHRLRETSVLKPQWVTEGIYGLLRYAQKRDCHGLLEREWIQKALPVDNYPAEKHGFVMELMEKFEVAFALGQPDSQSSQPKEPSCWLIPELLPEVQPAVFEEFKGAGVKRLRFSYPEALPPGLLPRFIVRTHEMSESHPQWRWRSGVVLEWIGARALVRLDRNERRTEVAVIGSVSEERQSLFDIIRAHLTTLHGKVPAMEEVQALDLPEKWVEMRELRMAELDDDQTIKVTVGTGTEAKRVVLPVVETLNTVESKAARKAAGPEAEPRMRLFISYAHENEKELRPFRQHLTHLSQQGYIQVWHDRDLVPGELWEAGIMEAIQCADIVLLFYTTAARISKFIQKTELTIALQRADANQCALLWVPLERNDLNPQHELERRLARIQCATRDAQAIYNYEITQKGWMDVEEAVRRAVEARRKLKRQDLKSARRD